MTAHRYALSLDSRGGLYLRKLGTNVTYHVTDHDGTRRCDCPAFRTCKHLSWADDFFDGLAVGLGPNATYDEESERLTWEG